MRRPIQPKVMLTPTEGEAQARVAISQARVKILQARVAMADVKSFKCERITMPAAVFLCVRVFNSPNNSNAKEQAISEISSRVLIVVLAALLKDLDASGWQNGILLTSEY
jgi:hypothetical protein